MEEKRPTAGYMECSENNVAAFNARLRAELPEAYALAKAFHEAGMIDGLRGARIGPVGSLPGRGVVPILSAASESRLADKALKMGIRTNPRNGG